ncbi:hypothetical protein V8V91_16145 [Algoriphagus halophilus]|uniref:hypothetical protein n=1 Tax=Algoriphagus halophilus TaxID=226505 RepID=UPI00358DDABC
MDKVLLKDLKKQDKYSKFFHSWKEQEFKDSPNEEKMLADLEVLSQNIGMREGLVIACFDYRNLSLGFFTGNIEELTGYPASMFKSKGMETSFTMIHPDDREELFVSRRLCLMHFISYPLQRDIDLSFLILLDGSIELPRKCFG